MREFVFAPEFDPGTNPVADILAAHSETRLRSLSCHVTAETLWRADHVTGSEAALDAVVVFLDKNDDRAWKATTIVEQLGLDTDAVSAILSRLRQRGLVRHKRPYWAITDGEERLQSVYRLHRHYKNADEQYGEERFENFQTDEMEDVQ